MVPLTLSIVAALGLAMMLARLRDPVDSPGTVNATLGLVAAVMALMSITRHQVRALYLAADRARFHIASAPQWLNIVLFLVLLVAGLALVGYMVRRVLTSPASGDQAA